MTEHIQRIETETLKQVAKQIKRGVSPEYSLEILAKIGYNIYDIENKLEDHIDLSIEEMREVFEEGIRLAYENDVELYKQGGKSLVNPQAVKQMEILAERSLGDFKNLTKNTGTVYQNRFLKFNDYAQVVIDNSLLSVQSGLFDYNTAISRALRELGNEGIRFMHYESGRRVSIEAAVRSNILTTLSQVTGKLSEMNADMMDQDLMIISSHIGARPSHAIWQGEIVSRKGRNGYLSVDDIGYGDVEGFKGANCRHDWYPYFEGISEKPKKITEPAPITHLGKRRTFYECTQIQRTMERQMRQTIRKRELFNSVGDVKNEAIEKIRLREQRKRYKAFSVKAGLPLQYERLMT